MGTQTCDRSTTGVHISVRVPPEVKAELNRRAKAGDRTLSYYLNRLFAEHIAEAS